MTIAPEELIQFAADSAARRPGNLPPIAFAPWCEDGNGHTQQTFPDDQWCSAGYASLPLRRDRGEVTVSLNRDPGEASHITLVIGKSPAGTDLTLEEARWLENHLSELLGLAKSEEAAR